MSSLRLTPSFLIMSGYVVGKWWGHEAYFETSRTTDFAILAICWTLVALVYLRERAKS